MENAEIQAAATEIAAAYGLTAEFWSDIIAVGVQGDKRVYLPVVCLIGPNPGHEILAKVSTKLTNQLPLSHVVYELATKKPGA